MLTLYKADYYTTSMKLQVQYKLRDTRFL